MTTPLQTGSKTGGQPDSFLLAVDGLHKSFGARSVLRGVSLSVPRGSLFTVLGPSGAGKSVLLKCLANIETPDAGQISFDGRALDFLDRATRDSFRRRCSFLFQGNALLDSLDSFKAFVDTNTSSRLGIALAPYHIQALDASVPEAIRICGDQLLFFYAWQRHPESKQLPGIGPTDMAPWIKALADIQYRGYVNPFMHGHPEPDVMAADLAKSRDYLRKCYEEAIHET